MNVRLLFLCTANSPCNGALMMRMLPRVETTGCMRRLFIRPRKNINRLKKLDFISTPFLRLQIPLQLLMFSRGSIIK
jgi:hypothetical protein